MKTENMWMFSVLRKNCNIMRISEWVLIRGFHCSTGNMIAPNYPTFGPVTPPVITSPTSPRSHAHPPQAPPAAIFQQPIVYWGYPNSPMSPTTAYFGPLQIPPHAYPQFSPNFADSRLAPLVSAWHLLESTNILYFVVVVISSKY